MQWFLKTWCKGFPSATVYTERAVKWSRSIVRGNPRQLADKTHVFAPKRLHPRMDNVLPEPLDIRMSNREKRKMKAVAKRSAASGQAQTIDWATSALHRSVSPSSPCHGAGPSGIEAAVQCADHANLRRRLPRITSEDAMAPQRRKLEEHLAACQVFIQQHRELIGAV
eukprot:SAG31_NODE_479_length_15133_cov_39.816283_5_plen_168_part_00